MGEKLKGFCYDGRFPLAFLRDTERVRAFPSAGKGSCEIIVGDFITTHGVNVGDCVTRATNGEILVIEMTDGEQP